MEMFDGYSVEELAGVSERCSEITKFYSGLFNGHTSLFPRQVKGSLGSIYDILNKLDTVVKAIIRVIDARETLGEEAAKTVLSALRSELNSIYSTLYDRVDSDFYHYVVFGKK